MSQKKIVKFVKCYTQKGYLRRQLNVWLRSLCYQSNIVWLSYLELAKLCLYVHKRGFFNILISRSNNESRRTHGFLWSLNFFSGFLQTARILPEWLCTNNNSNKQKNRHHDHLHFIQHCQILLFVLLQSSRTSAFLRLHVGTSKEKSIWNTERCHPVELASNKLLERVWIPL